jgi:uncharacterized membrane protein
MTQPITTIAKGDGSGIVRPRRTVVRNDREWQAVWAAHAGPAVPAPEINFADAMVAAAFAGERPGPGYAIEITEARVEAGTLVVGVNERVPARGGVSAQMTVFPFHIVQVARHAGEVRFSDAAGMPPSSGSAADPEDPVPRGRALSPNAPSSTGLDPNLAAALAYLAGPFSGVLILLVERANGFIRFHAWQSILGLGGIGVLSAATLVLSFATLLISPFLFTVMYRFSEIVAILWVVAWAICLVKAFRGSRWEMPLVGRYAARLAERR